VKILVDVDGVLAETVSPAVRWVNWKYGTKFRKSDIREYDQPLKGTGTDIGAVLRILMRDAAFVRDLHSVPHAPWALQSWIRSHRIVIATSRPSCVDQVTRRWLGRRGIWYNEYVNTEGKSKSALEGDVLIDDCAANCQEFVATGRPAILFDQPWNRNAPVYPWERIHRALCWAGVLEKVRFLTALQKACATSPVW